MIRSRPTDLTPAAPYEAPTPYMPPPFSTSSASPSLELPPMAKNVPTVMGLLKALKRRWVLACFLGILAAVASAAGFWLAAPTGKHQVKSLVEIKPIVMIDDRAAADSNDGARDFRDAQEVLIKTRSLLSNVVRDAEVNKLPLINGNDESVKYLEDIITTKWPAPSLMAIIMSGDQPDQLKIIMEVLVRKYLEQSKLDMQSEYENRKKTLQKELDKVKTKYDNQLAFIDEMNKSGIGSHPQQNAEMLLRMNGKITKIEELIDTLKTNTGDLESRVKTAKARLEKPDSIKAPPAIVENALDQDGTIAATRIEMETAVATFKDIQERLKPDNPSFIVYQNRVTEAKKKYDAARTARREQIEKSLATFEKAKIEEELSKNEAELTNTRTRMVTAKQEQSNLMDEYKKLNRRANTIWSEVDIAHIKERMLKLSEQISNIEPMLTSEGRIVEREKPIVTPNPNIKQKMLFGVGIAMIAFFGVLAAVAFLEWRSRRVDSVDQVLNELNMRILGTIPAFPSRASLKAGEADMNQNWRFILNESVNSARTMLLHSAKTQSMQVIMVTSAMQGEGKTSLASQLATSMATAGLRTLILDMDLRNPSMNRLFDLPLTPGASEVILQEIDVSDAVQPTTVPNLWVIPAGQCSNRVIASLAQGHPIETLFNRLRGQFDFIVVDTCPVLPVADALLIGQHVDGVVISILQDISQLPKVLNASERLNQLNIPLLGAVVNGVKTDIHAYGYNYVKQLPA
jgi:polysaccharide biosynthesis transport protein